MHLRNTSLILACFVASLATTGAVPGLTNSKLVPSKFKSKTTAPTPESVEMQAFTRTGSVLKDEPRSSGESQASSSSPLLQKTETRRNGQQAQSGAASDGNNKGKEATGDEPKEDGSASSGRGPADDIELDQFI